MLSSSPLLAQVALSFLLSGVSLVNARSITPRATTCNGHAELCDRSYGNVTFVGAHDSYAVSTTTNLAANQDYDVTQQLNDGVRLLQMQAHNSSGTIQLCHTTCLLYNGGTLQDYLGKVKTWMDSNTNEVVTLLIVNSDDFLPTVYDTVFKAAGLDTLSYAPSSSAITTGDWPTLGSMIDGGTRLVTFLDAMADFTSVPYLIDEFTNVWETAFDVTDTTFNCTVDRTKGDTSTQMYLINHFLDTEILGSPAPDVTDANTTNAVDGLGSLGVQALQTCPESVGRYPNYMLVDFYEYGGGSVFEVAATANGVTYTPSSSIATPLLTSSTSTSSSSSGSTSGAVSVLPARQTIWSVLAVVGGIFLGSLTMV